MSFSISLSPPPPLSLAVRLSLSLTRSLSPRFRTLRCVVSCLGSSPSCQVFSCFSDFRTLDWYQKSLEGVSP